MTESSRASRPFESPMTLAIRNSRATVAANPSLVAAGADVAEADSAQAVAADPSVIDAERHPLYGNGVQSENTVQCCDADTDTRDTETARAEAHALGRGLALRILDDPIGTTLRTFSTGSGEGRLDDARTGRGDGPERVHGLSLREPSREAVRIGRLSRWQEQR